MQPLAERLRPKTLDEYIGQKHLVGPGAVLRKMIDAGRISSFILWGPPGVGKTTLAQIIANKLETPFYTLSAVTSGVKDVRDVIERAKSNRFFSQASPILFIDEIHRFSKSQQDSLLGAVEQGTVMMETARKGMWKASEQQLADIAQLHTQLIAKYKPSCSGFVCDNAKLRDFIASKTDAASAVSYRKDITAIREQMVEGTDKGMVMKKEQVNTQTDETTNVLSNTVVVCVVLVLVVALILLVRRRHKHLND